MKPVEFIENNACFKFFDTLRGKYLKFFVLLIMDLVDGSIDWFFYLKVQLIQPGLVYGPPSSTYKWILFSFCLMSIFTLIIETIQNADDLLVKKKFPFLSQSLTNLLNIVLEDIPLLVLNLMLALCRDGDVTVISLIKASLGIVIVVVRFGLMIVTRWMLKKKKSRFEFVCDMISTGGLVAVAGLAIAIQLLNTFPSDSRGFLQFPDPQGFDRTQFLSDKYLHNVSIYMRWPPHAQYNLSKISDDTFVRLADIADLHELHKLRVEIKMDMDDLVEKRSDYNLCISRFLVNETKECFTVRDGFKFFKNESLVNSSMKFGYELVINRRPPMEFKYLVGYLDYNMNRFKIDGKSNEKNCEESRFMNTEMMRYGKYFYRMQDTGNSTYFKENKGFDYYGFYSSVYDLIGVEKLWKTGVIGCVTNADKGPKQNTFLYTFC